MTNAKRLAAAALALCALAANATDLMEAWQAARQHDPEAAVSQASRLVGEARRAQAASLWRPSVTLSGTAGRMNADTGMTGARFAAPSFGQSDGVAFSTSIHDGTTTRWELNARQPLFNRERQAQGRQLEIEADAANLEWLSARQDLMLRTAQRYFDVILAGRKLDLLRQQQRAVEKALAEAKDRFALGDVPITDTHEAAARAQGLHAQVLSAESELQLTQVALADATGLTNPSPQPLPAESDVVPADLQLLEHWLAEAMEKNPLLRMQLAHVQAAQQEIVKHSATAAATLDLIGQAKRERLSGNGDFGAASNTVSQQMIGVQLNVPLYTGGYRSARQEEALHLEEKARAEVERTRQQISQQTRSAWLGLHAGRARITALSESLKASQARLGATQLGRQVGDRTTLDLLNAENDASGAELALVQARIEMLLNQLRLYALAGQLDDSRLEAVNALLRR